MSTPNSNVYVSRRPNHRASRKNLAQIKCCFCRAAKQKCQPVERQWPGQKCDRCSTRNLQCSEGRRANDIPSSPSRPMAPTMETQSRHVALAPKITPGTTCQLQPRIPNIENTSTSLPKPHTNHTTELQTPKSVGEAIQTVLHMTVQELNNLQDKISKTIRDERHRISLTDGVPDPEGIIAKRKISEYDNFARILDAGKLLSRALATLHGRDQPLDEAAIRKEDSGTRGSAQQDCMLMPGAYYTNLDDGSFPPVTPFADL